MQPSCRPKRDPPQLTKADPTHYETSTKTSFPTRNVGKQFDQSRYQRAPIVHTKADADTFVTTNQRVHDSVSTVPVKSNPVRPLKREASHTPADISHFVTTTETHHGMSPPGARTERMQKKKEDAVELSPARKAQQSERFVPATGDATPNVNHRANPMKHILSPNAKTPKETVMGELLSQNNPPSPSPSIRRGYSANQYPSNVHVEPSDFTTTNSALFTKDTSSVSKARAVAAESSSPNRFANKSASVPASPDHFVTSTKSHFTSDRASQIATPDRSRYVQKAVNTQADTSHWQTSSRAHFQKWN